MTSVRGILAFSLGVVVGSAVNMGLVVVGPNIVPPPEGVDMADLESIRSAIDRFEAKHFVFPFLAHALGTFAGALAAYLIAAAGRGLFAIAIGLFFLAGGIAASTMIPAPAWFIALDLAVAYLPMALLAALVGQLLVRPAAAKPAG